MKFRRGRGDIEDLAFGVLCLRALGRAELGACLTHGRGELRSSREHNAKNGVKNLKGAQAIPEFHPPSPRMPCNKADAVRSARPEGKI